MNRVILKKDLWGFYNVMNKIHRNTSLITLLLLTEDMGSSLYLYIENLKKNRIIDTEQTYSQIENNFVIITDRFAEQDGVLNQLVISRENLINVLEKWRKFSTQKTNEIILTHHDDGTVSIE